MNYEIEKEIEEIVEEVANFLYSVEDGVQKLKRFLSNCGYKDKRTLNAALRQYERVCRSRGV